MLISFFPPAHQTVIISGRDSAFLESYMGQHTPLTLVAEHGYIVRPAFESEWVLASVGGRRGVEEVEEDSEWREDVMEQVRKVCTTIPGSFVEEKEKSIVWHHRAAPDEDGEEGAESLLNLMESIGFPMDRVSKGNKMVEIFGPSGATKGSCMRDLISQFLQEEVGDTDIIVMSAGDDVTDETMFSVSKEMLKSSDRDREKILDMVSVKVGAGKSGARYRVGTPADLRRFLGMMLTRISSSPLNFSSVPLGSLGSRDHLSRDSLLGGSAGHHLLHRPTRAASVGVEEAGGAASPLPAGGQLLRSPSQGAMAARIDDAVFFGSSPDGGPDHVGKTALDDLFDIDNHSAKSNDSAKTT